MTTVLTGATDGIGLALARRYRQSGDDLVLVGRRSLDDLDDDLFTEPNYCRIDLGADGETDRMGRFLEERGIEGIDRLILNAGTGYFGRTQDQTTESIRETVAVNLRSSIALIHQCSPYLKAARGKVVLIGSVIAALPCPDYAVYGATKAAVDGLGRSLKHELAPDVRVQVVHPGATRTGLHEKIGVDRSRVDWTRFPDAEGVADAIAKEIEKRGWRSIPGRMDRMIWRAGRRMPRLIDHLAGRR